MVSERALDGKVAIVTGGSSGIGRATVRALAEQGAAVCVFDRNPAGGHAVVADLEAAGVSAAFVEVDLADANAIPVAVEEALRRFGRIDILVNAAGVRVVAAGKTRAGLFDIDAAGWDFVQAVNLRAPFLLTQAVGRHMVERGDGGRIVNVSSMAAFTGRYTSVHYAASKAGVSSLTRTTAAELGPHRVNVNAVAPGTTRTPMMLIDRDEEALRRGAAEGPGANFFGTLAEPEDIADVICFLCLPASRHITGQTIQASAGMVV